MLRRSTVLAVALVGLAMDLAAASLQIGALRGVRPRDVTVPPSGYYQGDVDMGWLGITWVKLKVDVEDGLLDMAMGGEIKMVCMAEPYTYDPGDILTYGTVTLDNLSDAEDCIAASMEASEGEIQGFDYDKDTDKFHLAFFRKGVHIYIDADKVVNGEPIEATGSE
mmetsp:Transcript_44949/g.140794  ORF Transcript_44949/g.140794 Transcript_44949/m.140794 type:complete len:166 (-) Transcript_44949:238-735(-)|eukprot:CAMPEP_0118869538 /NCGR_PEP_ID=MMETSP1163-20130328/12842_1 /TAXON_ID=124430 /ORGANISM="Phaeomonas parva, Strain CCMP2877" /LENGTH=165 /DNA_ID=CAMNT_0006804441 /DNA_START=150 /DNA_END=647 /DNA_ORIENTATION=+